MRSDPFGFKVVLIYHAIIPTSMDKNKAIIIGATFIAVVLIMAFTYLTV